MRRRLDNLQHFNHEACPLGGARKVAKTRKRDADGKTA
jgi:hypothetical protein